jgi:hypothetical protein
MHYANRRLKMRLKMRLKHVTISLRLRTLAGTQAAARAVPRLLLDQARHIRLIALEHQVPHAAFGIAEARKCAQRFCVVKHQGRALDVFGLNVVWLAAGRFGAVKANPLVRAVTKRLGGGLPAATQRIAVRGWPGDGLAFPPRQ